MKTAKDMHKVYSGTSTVDLIKNKGRKLRKLHQLEQMDGYFVKKERIRLRHMIDQIDAVLEARAAQQPLF